MKRHPLFKLSVFVFLAKKKKKKKKPKKKSAAAISSAAGSAILVQTEPPSVPVASMFPSGIFPEGELQDYKDELSVFFSSMMKT